MQKYPYKSRTIKKHYDKANGVVKLYSDLQYRFADYLESEAEVVSFEVNIKVLSGDYTTDFLVTYKNGSQIAYDCISDKKAIFRNKYSATLDQIKTEWINKGIEWSIVIED